MIELTERQREVLQFITDFRDASGYPPSQREIMDRFGFHSTNAVNDHLEALEKKGAIRRHPMRARGITVLVVEDKP